MAGASHGGRTDVKYSTVRDCVPWSGSSLLVDLSEGATEPWRCDPAFGGGALRDEWFLGNFCPRVEQSPGAVILPSSLYLRHSGHPGARGLPRSKSQARARRRVLTPAQARGIRLKPAPTWQGRRRGRGAELQDGDPEEGRPRVSDPADYAEGGRLPIRVIIPQVPITRVRLVGSVPRVVLAGVQHFDGHGFRARQLRAITHRYELAFVAALGHPLAQVPASGQSRRGLWT